MLSTTPNTLMVSQALDLPYPVGTNESNSRHADVIVYPHSEFYISSSSVSGPSFQPEPVSQLNHSVNEILDSSECDIPVCLDSECDKSVSSNSECDR